MAEGTGTILEARDRYLDTLALRGRSPRTLRAYGDQLAPFFAFLSRRGIDPATMAPHVLTVDHIELYLAERTRGTPRAGGAGQRGVAPATRRLILQALSGFYRYLCLRDLLTLNTESLRARLAALTVKVPRRRPDPPSGLSRTTEQQLVAAPAARRKVQNVQSALLQLRNEALLQTLYSTGMRVGEVVALNRTQIQEDGHALITGKGGKQRAVYFSEPALAALRAYLAARADDLPPLFLQHHNPVRSQSRAARKRAGDDDDKNTAREAAHAKAPARDLRLSARMVQRVVRDVARAAGLEATPHTYRHNFATEVLHSGILDVRDVQELLGHASLATTQIYLHPRRERLAGALRTVFGPGQDEGDA